MLLSAMPAPELDRLLMSLPLPPITPKTIVDPEKLKATIREAGENGIAFEPGGKIVLPRRIKPGSVLVREWKGKSHRVMVLADGFAYDGETYGNLSEIAVLITGTRWNGPRFFGLRSKTQESDEPAGPGRSDGAKRNAEAASARSSHLGGGSDYRERKATLAGKSVSSGGRHGR
jgi:hypothetical protein